jgi:predicted dehydrogenase
VHVVPVFGIEILVYGGRADYIGWDQSGDGIVEWGGGVIEGSEAERGSVELKEVSGQDGVLRYYDGNELRTHGCDGSSRMISRHTSKHSHQRQPQDNEGEPVFGERHVAQIDRFSTLGLLFHELDE